MASAARLSDAKAPSQDAARVAGLDDGQPAVMQARQKMLEAMPIAAAIVCIKDGKLLIQSHNREFNRLNNGGRRARGKAPDLVHSEGLQERITAFLVRPDDESEKFDWRDGGAVDARHFRISLSFVAESPELGRRCLVTMIDRTSEVQAEHSLRLEMFNDSLTGLPNRAGFVEILEDRMAADQPELLGILMINLSRFSRINECIGSMAGDELLITVARRFVSALRASDALARIGNDEFGVVINLEDGPGDALHVAKRVRDALATPCRLSDLEIKVDCAIGCSFAVEAEADAEMLIRQAQNALKRGKVTGKVEVYQSSGLSSARRRFSIETELRRALDREELTLAYQPLVDLGTGKVAGFEALARWTGVDGVAVSPAEFITVAEDSGLIVPLGRWALDRVARTLADWDARAGTKLPIYLGVNVSAIQVARDEVSSAVERSLSLHGLEGYRLTLELTESTIVAEPERAARVMESLKELDCTVAMDDFGTGYSNLASLQKLPIDILKIDRSFVSGMLGDQDKTAIVRAILSLAQALGMTTTAEGIESIEQAQTLAALGCNTGQGYFYARPMSEEAALAYALASFA